MVVSEDIRREIVRLSSSGRTRRVDFSPSEPCEWKPTSITDPRSGKYFSDASAWEFLADCFERALLGDIYRVELDRPPGKLGYTLQVPGVTGKPPIYMKVQIVSGAVKGRSFHYSKSDRKA